MATGRQFGGTQYEGLAAEPLGALLDATVARFPDRPAMDFLGRRWTFDALATLVDRATRGLQDLGVVHGTRVGLCLPNSPYSVIFYYAALKAGAVVVNYNPLYVERELLSQIRDSGTEIMVTIDAAGVFAKVRAVAAESGLRRIILCPLGAALPPLKALAWGALKRRERARPAKDDPLVVPYARVIARAGAAAVAIDPARDVAVLQYTGGTTGVPKGAMLTHANLVANTRQVVGHMPSLRAGEERVLAVLPCFHVFAMTSVLNFAIATGAEMLLLPRFELAKVIALIEKRRPSIFPAVPTIYGAINAACAERRHDLSSIRCCISGGAPLPADVRARFEELTGCKVVEGYGLSEASPVVACNPPDGQIKDGTVGVPVRGTVIEIRDPNDPDRLMPVGEKGEICVRGPQVMAGYWQRPAETRAAFHAGALRTGDIGFLDADGYLTLVDRIKDVILCGGYNVYPRVIEEALYQHPAVAEAIVIGIPDPYRGQAPKAFVKLRDGEHATPEALRTHLEGYVSKIELPRAIEIRDVLPKTMIGKLSKKELVAEEAAAASRHATGD